MPHLGQDKGALSVEIVHFTVVGGDVGAAQHGAYALTVEVLALPLAVGARAVNTATVNSTGQDGVKSARDARAAMWR